MSVRLTSVTVNTGSVTGYRGSELTVARHSVSLKKKGGFPPVSASAGGNERLPLL